jgi:uncharacterized membrane protein YbhN (UPF0104 family)
MAKLSKKMLRTFLAATVILTTIAVFIWYLNGHPEIIRALKDIPRARLALLLALYGVFQLTLVWIQRATLELCDLKLGRKESALVVMYSSIINFFGPLQSGPAFRAAYLKSRYNLSLKKYGFATLLYYLFYGLFSILLLGAYLIGWWAVPVCIVLVAVAPLAGRIPRFSTLDINKARNLAAASLSQVLIMTVIYFVEIRTFAPTVSYIQGLIYTGAANLALFVSLTPGAIGFRETFLVFSQSLHHVSNQVIAAASIVDRAVYIVLLLICAAIVFGLHAQDSLRVKK